MPIDDRTSTQNYPKPNIANTLADDVGRLRTALDDIDEDMAAKAPTVSPTFTGTPAAPTAAADTNTTQLATTAFVVGQAGSTSPAMDGAATVGSSLKYARADHVHPTDTSRATSTHVHGNITNAGAIGSTANLPIITTTSGVLTAGSFGTAANTFCQGDDARLSDTRLTTNSVTFNNAGSGGASGSTFNGGSALTVSHNTVGAPSTTGSGASGTWDISVTGNAATATALSSTRTFALTGDVTGTVNSDLASGASIATSIAASSIVDADVNASAAIAGTKISPNFGSQAVSTTGTITGASLIPTSATVPANGLYLPAANTVGIATNSLERMRVDSAGRLLLGTTTSLVFPNRSSTPLNAHSQQAGTSAASSTHGIAAYFTDTSLAAAITFAKSNNAALGSHTAVTSGTSFGELNFAGSDGTGFFTGASITGIADGTPATGSVSGALLFRTTPAGSAAATERMRIRSDGNIGIGGSGGADSTFRNHGPITGATTAHANYTTATVQSDVTVTAYGYRTLLGTAAATFTLNNLDHFRATQTTFGAGSSVAAQYGFRVDSSLDDAGANYAFHSNLSSANCWNFYANGTAPNYFAGDVRSNTTFTYRSSSTTSNTSATVTAASLIDGLRIGTPTAPITYTLPTGTNMDAAFQDLQSLHGFEWSVINGGSAANTITVAPNTDHTTTGNMVVAGQTSGRFLTRKSSANTFITYRIA